MITPEFIRLRYIEAADVDLHMDRVKGPSSKSAWWPGYYHSESDKRGWGGDIIAEDRALFFRESFKPSKEAIARWGEVIEWTNSILLERERKIVWGWAFCKALNRPFRSWCKMKGFVVRTSYLRIDQAIARVAALQTKKYADIHNYDEKRLAHLVPDMIYQEGIMDNIASVII